MNEIFRRKNISLKECRYGPMLYLNTDMYVGRALEQYGEYSELELSGLLQFIQPAWSIIEVGANMGTFTVPFAKTVGIYGRVHAFEPQTKLYQVLSANLALNQVDNATTYRMALGSAEGLIAVPSFKYDKEDNFGSLSLDPNNKTNANTAIIKLDSLGISCHLLKIDVEGMETDVLMGAKEMIKQCRPVIHVENDRGKEKSETLIKFLQEMNYRMYWHITDLYNPSNFSKNETNLWPGYVTANVLAIHDSLKQNVELPEILSCKEHWSFDLGCPVDENGNPKGRNL